MADWNGPQNPSLDARIEGSQLFTAEPGTTNHHVVFDFDCDFNGVEFYAWNSNPGDNVQLKTEYYVPDPIIPGGGWKRYKKFGKNFNIYPNHVTKILLFPTKPKQGVRLTVVYENKGQSDIQFSFNKFQFVDMATVKTSQLEEGEDW